MGCLHFSALAGEGEEGNQPHMLITTPTTRMVADLKVEPGSVLGRHDLKEVRRNLGGVCGRQSGLSLVQLLCVLD